MAPIGLVKRIGVAQEAATSSSSGISSVAYVGFGVAGLFVLGVVATFLFIRYRKKRRQEKEEERGVAFLTVKGVLKEGLLASSLDGGLPADPFGVPKAKGGGFSRANLTASIVLPEKSIIRPTATREEIISFYEEQGDIPKPFAPFHFALNAASSTSSVDTLTPPTPVMTSGGKKDYRISTASFSASAARLSPLPPSPNKRGSVFASLRDSFLSSASSSQQHQRGHSHTLSISSSIASGGLGLQMQSVRQLFTPILPDEPTLVLGERVAIMKSHDDGWCVVARDKPYAPKGEIELGAVPAWCFVKPMKGLRSERPIRSSSLGVTVELDGKDGAGGEKPRGEYISWSNF